MKFRPHKTIFDKIWRRFFIFSFLIQLCMGLFIFYYGGRLMATRIGANMVTIASIINVVSENNDPVLMAKVQAEVTKNDKYVIKSDSVTTSHVTTFNASLLKPYDNSYSNALPLYPAMMTFGKVVDDLCKNCFIASYQNSPPMLWLQSKQAPYYSLGITLFAHHLFWVYITVFILLSILSAIGMASWISKRITLPLLKLSKQAELIVNEPETSIDQPLDSLFEVNILAEALNKMQNDIDHLITERELFLAEISHDLRTPLHRLNVALQIQEPKLMKYAEGIQADIKEMSMIINQSMNLTHVNNALNEPWFDGDINELLIELKAKYIRSAILLDLDLDKTMPAFPFKRVSVIRLLYNLINNALRYGNGEVIIVSAMDGVIPTVSVINSMGDLSLDTDTLPSTNTINDDLNAGSNKLGLEIVKRITKMHNIGFAITNNEETKTYEAKLSFILEI